MKLCTLGIFGTRLGLVVAVLSLMVAPSWAQNPAVDHPNQSDSGAQEETESPSVQGPKRPVIDTGVEAIRKVKETPEEFKDYFWAKVEEARQEPWRETADQVLIDDPQVRWNRYLRALLKTPEWLDIGLAHRMRYESLSNNFRAGQPEEINGVVTRSRLRIGADWKMFRLFVESQNSSDFGDLSNGSGTLNSSLFTQDRLLQGFIAIKLEDVLGTGLRTDLHLGRMTLDFGNRRLIARNDFRNTTNAFEGGHLNVAQDQIWRIRAFLVKPIADSFGVLQPIDHTLFWGVQYEDRRESWMHVDLYYFGINGGETVEQSRTFGTYGTRYFRSAKPGQFDYEGESALQAGSRGYKDYFAYFQHAELGYTFMLPWQPRLLAQYDYASGTPDPNGNTNHTFDTLFGARRPEYTPTGAFGPFFRSNISSPGARLILQPRDELALTLKYRAWFLAQAKDAWVGSGLQDPTGQSGNFLGQDVEVRIQWRWDTLTSFDIGYDHLFKGSYIENQARVPGNPSAKDSDYFYLQTEIRF